MNLFQHTHRICFELSNRCNYSFMHRACPAYSGNIHDTKTLKTEIILSVLQSATVHDYKGAVSFHVYNEPLIDPRLMDLISETHIIGMKPFILTNGWYLDENILNDLFEAGTQKIQVTTYSTPEYDRIHGFAYKYDNISIQLTHVLDNRLNIYDGPVLDNKQPCAQPLGELMIRHNGKVGLCCNDWAMQVTFGDLRHESIEEILRKPDMEMVRDDLMIGIRDHNICMRCKGGRMNPDETNTAET